MPDYLQVAKRLYQQLLLTTAALETPGDLSDEDRAYLIRDSNDLLTDVESEVKGNSDAGN